MIGAVTDRPRVLVTLSTYLPGFRSGGPIRTIANLVEWLGDEFLFHIVAADRDEGDSRPYPEVVHGAWTPVGKALVFYRPPGLSGWRALFKSLRALNFDLIYLNSFFGMPSLIVLTYRRMGRLGCRPILLATRGEFSVGALALKSLKKRLFLQVTRRVGLYRDVIFNASSELEAADIRRILGSVEILVAGNLSSPLPVGTVAAVPPSEGRRLRAVFLSRISRMKNLEGALDILSSVSCQLDFDIYGVIEDAPYWERCQKRISSLPPNITVRYCGEARPDQVETILAAYDFFLLPTFGENFGHAIREALSAGLPVLISDQTPWRGLAALDAGADIALGDKQRFVDWVEAFAVMTPSQREIMREGARRAGSDVVAANRSLDANRDMLYAAMSRGRG